MKILFLATDYPYDAHPASGVYNERCVQVMREHCEAVEVLVTRPIVPPLFARFSSRWSSYSKMVKYETRAGVPVHRPGYLQVPRINPSFWLDPGAFYWCRGHATQMHRRVGFDAILAFGLVSGFAWRLGKHWGIPAIAWAIGLKDVRAPLSSPRGRSIAQAIGQLDMVFYQSRHLRSLAAAQRQVPEQQLQNDRHVVLPHGIPTPPPAISIAETRSQVRKAWRISENETVVLFIGRIVRDKGVFDLLEAVKIAGRQARRLTCILVGAFPGFDDTREVERLVQQDSLLKDHVKILPSCHPDRVWEYLSAADLFGFPSYEEGMPNALLEAMSLGIPSVAYDIPPVNELEGGTGGIVLVPTGNIAQFAEALVGLSNAPDARMHRGRQAKTRVHESFMVAKNIPEALTRIERLIAKEPVEIRSAASPRNLGLKSGSSWQP